MEVASGSHCWSIAFSSSIGNVVDPELQVPVLALGKLCFTTLSQGVSVLCSSMRQWSINLVAHTLFTAVLMINPRLTPAQQLHLLSAATRAMEHLFLRHSLDQRLLRGILSLACPSDRASRLLLTYLLEILQGLLTGEGEAEMSPGSSDVESSGEFCDAARSLHRDFNVERVYVAVMPPAVRRAVLSALTWSDPAAQRGDDTAVRCCITLEPVVREGGAGVRADVVAVVQGGHAFLYRGTALYKWLAKPQVPLAPETRSVVRPMDVYRLSS